jgi:ribosomal protein S18 acetylase RimI-like enzyme
MMMIASSARAISDGEYYAGIYDVVVLPEYQSQGVGKQLMTALLEKLPVGNIILLAVQGKEGFYEKLGFARLKTGLGRFANMEGMRIMGYIE